MARLYRNLMVCAQLLLLGACATSLTDTSSWTKVTTTADNKATHYVNMSSKMRKNDTVEFKGKISPKAQKGGSYDHLINVWRINCKTREYSVLSTQFMDAKGGIIKTVDFRTQPVTSRTIVPGTVVEKQYQKMCF